jgi:hypothetical protein
MENKRLMSGIPVAQRGVGMSEYTAIRAVTRSLRELLRQGATLSTDPWNQED